MATAVLTAPHTYYAATNRVPACDRLCHCTPTRARRRCMHARIGRTPSRNVLYRPASLLLWTIHTSPVRWLFVRSGGRPAGESTGLPQQPEVCAQTHEHVGCSAAVGVHGANTDPTAYSRITLITVAQRLAQAQCI